MGWEHVGGLVVDGTALVVMRVTAQRLLESCLDTSGNECDDDSDYYIRSGGIGSGRLANSMPALVSLTLQHRQIHQQQQLLLHAAMGKEVRCD
jgi:hypothetical protein